MKNKGILLLLIIVGCSKTESPQHLVQPVLPIQNQQLASSWQTVVEGVGPYESSIEGTILRLKINNTIPFTELTLSPFLVDLVSRLVEVKGGLPKAPFQQVEVQAVGNDGGKLEAKIAMADGVAYKKGEISQPELVRRLNVQLIDTLDSLKKKVRNAREQGNLEEAETALEKWVGMESSSNLALSLLGNVYRDEKKYWKAVSTYQKILLMDIRSRFALMNLGYCYDRLGALDDAVRMYQRTLEVDPNNVGVVVQLAEALRKNGNGVEAETWIQKGFLPHGGAAYSESVGLANLSLVEGNIDRDAKKYKEALEAYDKARKLNPADSKSLFNSILVKLDQKQFSDARKRYAELQSVDAVLAKQLSGVTALKEEPEGSPLE